MRSVRRLSRFEAVGRRATVSPFRAQDLLVEGLGVGGGSRDVGVAGRLVGAGGEFQVIGCLEVGVAGRAVGGGVVLEVEEKSEHGGDESFPADFAAFVES